MEYQKLIILLCNASNQGSKFKTENWVKINGESCGKYNKDSKINFQFQC